MSLNGGGWWAPRTYHDRLQNSAIESLQNTISWQSSRLRRQTEEVQRAAQQVAGEVSGLADRLNTFMEYTDLRFEALKYNDNLTVRNAIESQFQALAHGETIQAPESADVRQYWMPPAAHYVLSVLSQGAVPTSRLETARGRDGVRTEAFLLAAGTCFERRDLSDPAVRSLLRMHVGLVDSPEPLTPDTQVSYLWRLLWIRVASGEFRDPAFSMLRERLAPIADQTTVNWADHLSKAHGAGPLEKLQVLREYCQSAFAAEQPAPPSVPDVQPWQDFVQELVAEGHTDERVILNRIREIRTGQEHPQTWSRPVGSLASLLCQDVTDPNASPGQRRLAIMVCADGLVAAADDLRTRGVKGLDTPDEIRVRGMRIKVTLGTADTADLRKVAQRIEESHRPEPARVLVPGALAAVGLALGAVFAILAQPGGAILAAMGTVAAGVTCAVAVFRARSAHAEREEEQHALEGQVREALAAFTVHRRRCEAQVGQIEQDHAAVHKLLGPYSTARPIAQR